MDSLFDKLFDKLNNKFYPENPEGNIEYKWRLDTKNELGYKKLLSQLLWRINEGYETTNIKKAVYLIGVYDNGNLGELSVDVLINSINIFKTIIKKADIHIEKEEIKQINTSYVYYAEVIKNEDELKINEKHLLVVGESQSGKTTLISQLCYESNVKNFVLKHSHEKISGTTTDIKKEIIGIKNDRIINYSDYGGWDQILEHSDIVINLYDIPVTNTKVIINYLLGINPDYIFIVYKNDINNVKFYISLCDHYNINYKLININDIIDFNKEYFNNILIDITKQNKQNKINTNLNDTNAIYRIIDYYDIPEKGCIVSGIQISNKFNSNQPVILYTGQNKYNILIKSIYKKTINSNMINENESGSFNIESTDNKIKIKITKNSYICDNVNYKNDNIYKFTLNKDIKDDIYNVILFNGNISYNTNIKIKDNIFVISNINSEYYLQDKKVLICIGALSFDNLIFCNML
jgi:GTPase SAR1 family protein